MSISKSWGTGILAGVLLFIGSFLAVIGIAMDGDQNARSILDDGSWASGAPVK